MRLGCDLWCPITLNEVKCTDNRVERAPPSCRKVSKALLFPAVLKLEKNLNIPMYYKADYIGRWHFASLEIFNYLRI